LEAFKSYALCKLPKRREFSVSHVSQSIFKLLVEFRGKEDADKNGIGASSDAKFKDGTPNLSLRQIVLPEAPIEPSR